MAAGLAAAGLNALLRYQAGVTLETVPCTAFDDALLQELYSLSNSLLNEEYAHFALHARSNHVVHIFRSATSGQLVGFQFWKCSPSLYSPDVAIIRGGKLRIAHAARGHGLHLASNLLFIATQKAQQPSRRLLRLSAASSFGFAALAPSVAMLPISWEYNLHAVSNLLQAQRSERV